VADYDPVIDLLHMADEHGRLVYVARAGETEGPNSLATAILRNWVCFHPGRSEWVLTNLGMQVRRENSYCGASG
jgi:hypothetical protein